MSTSNPNKNSIIPSSSSNSITTVIMDSSSCSSRRGSYTPTSSSTSGSSLANTKVSDLKLILVNAVVAGLEIASSVAFTFIPPLLLKSGYSETQMTIIFGVGKTLFFTVRVSENLKKSRPKKLVKSNKSISRNFFEYLYFP